MKETKQDCYKCKHRKDLVGDYHSSCQAKSAVVKGHPHGIKNGWFFWPYNFDPIWLVECNSFESKDNPSVG